MEFKEFSKLVHDQFDSMAKGELFVVDLCKDVIWNHYLDSFAEGDNELYKERREFDCQCCRQYIRAIGNVVAIKNGQLQSIWDVDATGKFKVVARAMSALVRSLPIKRQFLQVDKQFGQRVTTQLLEDGSKIDWNHFNVTLPSKYVNEDAASVLSLTTSAHSVFKRGLEELTLDSMDIVLDLIDSKSLYKGDEFEQAVRSFRLVSKHYSKLTTDTERDIYVWKNLNQPIAKFRNSVIGTLVQDLSEGKKGIDSSVASFEAKVAPTNYKRNSAPVTKGMVTKAVAVIDSLGLESALQRRHCSLVDLNINDVVYADRSAADLMKGSLTSMLLEGVKPRIESTKDIEDISIERFIAEVVPNVTSMEVLVVNSHCSNLMSLIAPMDKDASQLLQWSNDFSWSYVGNITDSIKERVKSAGGSVTGDLRISLSWFNKDDLDIHVIEPNRNTISFHDKHSHNTGGRLDVDMNVSSYGAKTNAVENITYPNRGGMDRGVYQVYVHNYTKRTGCDVGCIIEVEYDGVIQTFNYDLVIPNQHKVAICEVAFDGKNFAIKSSNPKAKNTAASQDTWGIKTETYNKVSSMMLSPNFWDDQAIGNKHYFFLLEDCINPEPTRGLYNEFLRKDLHEHRKTFEVLADKMLCPTSDEQLSGIGFNSTTRAELVCKVSGTINRKFKIKF